MPAVEERVTDLEYALMQLAHAQLKTEVELSQLSQEMREFKNEMGEFKNGMERFKIEAEKDRKRMDKAWGDLANKMGTVLEDIIAPNIRKFAIEESGCDPLQRFLVRAEMSIGDNPAVEFDVVAAGAGIVVVAESKSSVSEHFIKKFDKKTERLTEFFPEFTGWRLIRVFASWSINKEAVAILNREKIYGLEMGEDTMRFVNRGAF
jgi:Holliday junction resolvase